MARIGRERQVNMFRVGQYVVCGNKGVCTIEDITTLDISGVDKAKLYYILKPQYITASTVYVPVENASSLREVLHPGPDAGGDIDPGTGGAACRRDSEDPAAEDIQ